MSANPSRSDAPSSQHASSQQASPFDQAHRVLASIESNHGLHALLAFSDLRENIRNCRPAPGSEPAQRLLHAEAFVLQQLLNLMCVRALSLTRADIVLVALREEGEFICRAAAGSQNMPPNSRLNQASKFLQDALQSGKALRCDDTQIDPRTQYDFARQVRARSTLLVPLRGQTENLGVLQAVSTAPRSFTDRDARCLDLFAELILAALKPDDQDRRLEWLSAIADEILNGKPAATDLLPAMQAAANVNVAPGIATSAPLNTKLPEPELPVFAVEAQPPNSSPLSQPVAQTDVALNDFAVNDLAVRDLAAKGLPVIDPQHKGVAETGPPEPALLPVPAFLSEPAAPIRSRRGLNFALVAAFVIALFSAGVWLGMHVRAHDSHISFLSSSSTPASQTATTAADRAASSINNIEAPLAPSSEANLAALPKITGVRHWSSPAGSTVVIDMEDQANYEIHRLVSPERIYFDLHDTNLPSDLEGKTIDVGDASLTRVRIAQPVAGVTRVVLDTKDGSNFSVSMETSPYRLVVELRDTQTAVASNQPASAAKPANVASLPPSPAPPLAAHTGKFRVVLDAGHGGWDLGTVGRQGLLEKNLVLDVAERLGKLLQSRSGADVVFTRTSDDYVSLDQRADLANQAQADLFVSIHANYSSSATARGVETYYTNLFSAPGLKEIEKRPGAAAQSPATLSPASLQEKTDESRLLASTVQRALYATLAARSPGIRDRGIKDASFVVLTGTVMPSILTEISFVSSPADEQNLQSDNYRQQIAEALYKGIASYQQSAAKTKMAQLHASGSGR
jgi:N-acetylmuramoyl-L-alanine amidase/putative methionine-R-sulfoxide reductase with GAF domain